MTEDRFWSILEETRNLEGRAQAVALEKNLAKLAPDEIVEFERWFHTMENKAYRWDLWGAFYLLNGGCGDDGFVYSRAWLIGQGRERFEATLSDPDSMAEFVDPDDENENELLMYAAAKAYEKLTQGEMPAVEAFVPFPSEPSGESWEEDDLPDRFPRLAKLVEEEEEGEGEGEGEDDEE